MQEIKEGQNPLKLYSTHEQAHSNEHLKNLHFGIFKALSYVYMTFFNESNLSYQKPRIFH